MKCMLAVLALVACGGGTRVPTAPAEPQMKREIDAIAEAALREGGAVGLSIVVMRGDRIVHARGYGVADVERHIAATEHTVYLLASLSKQYWGVAIAQLVESGRLSVESSIVDVLYNFPERGVKVKHVLTQTSGLGDDSEDDDNVRFADAPKLAFEPGAWWRYSNRGAILARRIVEQLTSAAWDRYLQDHIAKPLGLAATTTCDAANLPAMYSADKQRVTESATKLTLIRFVCASALDVATFERSLDLGGLLRSETVATMRAPTELAGVSLPYGWLTRIAELDGHRAYGHTGNGQGVSIAAFRFPSDDLTIVVLMNSAPRPRFRAHELLARVARVALASPAPHLSDTVLTKQELDALVGTYREGPARAEISARDGHAYLTFHVADRKLWEGPLVTAGPRRFAGGPEGVDADAVAQFLPATGTATAIAVGHRFMLENVFRRD